MKSILALFLLIPHMSFSWTIEDMKIVMDSCIDEHIKNEPQFSDVQHFEFCSCGTRNIAKKYDLNYLLNLSEEDLHYVLIKTRSDCYSNLR